MTSKSYQTSVGYSRIGTKIGGGSPTSLSSHQSLIQSVGSPKNSSTHTTHIDPQHLSSIHKENSYLREQNRALRRQLNLMKGESMSIKKNIQPGVSQVNDLRDTIKKESGEIKELKTRIEVLSKQCKMYEEIIDKMEGKISKLTENNKILEQRVQLPVRSLGLSDPGLRKTLEPERQKVSKLKERINDIIVMYTDLQSQVKSSEEQWKSWKEQWGREKTYYTNRIRDLEELMGIGGGRSHESKQFFKKRPY